MRPETDNFTITKGALTSRVQTDDRNKDVFSSIHGLLPSFENKSNQTFEVIIKYELLTSLIILSIFKAQMVHLHF
jgi:hypothetical protein